MKLEIINERAINEANWYNRKKYNNTIDLLRNFAADNRSQIDSWFVSMTHIDKLGLNPRSKFNTPIGIYGYPLSYVIRAENIEDLPFAGEREYINLFKVDINDSILYSNDGPSITGPLLDDLYRKHPDAKETDISMYDMRSDISELWLRTWVYVNKDPKKWNHILRSIGVQGVVDLGTKTIHKNEPTQAVFFSIDVIKKVHRFLNEAYEEPEEETEDIKMHNEYAENLEQHTKNLIKYIKNGDLESLIIGIISAITSLKENTSEKEFIYDKIYRNIMKHKKEDLLYKIIDVESYESGALGGYHQLPFGFDKNIDAMSSEMKILAATDARFDIILKMLKVEKKGSIFEHFNILNIIRQMNRIMSYNETDLETKAFYYEEEKDLKKSNEIILSTLKTLLNSPDLFSYSKPWDFVTFIHNEKNLNGNIKNLIISMMDKKGIKYSEHKFSNDISNYLENISEAIFKMKLDDLVGPLFQIYDKPQYIEDILFTVVYSLANINDFSYTSLVAEYLDKFPTIEKSDIIYGTCLVKKDFSLLKEAKDILGVDIDVSIGTFLRNVLDETMFGEKNHIDKAILMIKRINEQ